MDDSSCQTSSDRIANEQVQNFCLPIKISHHRRQSPIRLKPGYLNVAGLFVFEEKVSDPGKGVALDQSRTRKPPFLRNRRGNEQREGDARAGEVQPT